MYNHNKEFWPDAVGVDEDRVNLLIRTFSEGVIKKKMIKASEFTEYLEGVMSAHELTSKEKAILFTIFFDRNALSVRSPLFPDKSKSKYMASIPILRGINIAFAVFLIGATFIQENWLALIAWVSIIIYLVSDLLKERLR